MGVRPIAIHLPQYHPIPENDEWWGKGFTEWTNVTKARPLYKGHYQPHLPTDLGFYDLRLEEARLAQIALAKANNIYGFCYYHYWFNGKRLLHEPIDRMLQNSKEDFPFMLCWANENWTRVWDGADRHMLLEQNYGEEDDITHMQFLVDIFKDNRYIKVNGKPVFVVYKPYLFKDAVHTAKVWRQIAAKAGLELYLCHMVFGYADAWQTPVEGFDAVIDFEPFGIRRGNIFKEIESRNGQFTLLRRILSKFFIKPDSLNKINYTWMVENLCSLKDFGFKIYPSLVPGWDNTARRKNPALILDDSSPEKFERWWKSVIEDFEPYSDEENFVFINAWNE